MKKHAVHMFQNNILFIVFDQIDLTSDILFIAMHNFTVFSEILFNILGCPESLR